MRVNDLACNISQTLNTGDYSPEAILKGLTAEATAYGGFGEDARGKNATERVANITKQTDPNSPLGMQMADLAKRKAMAARPGVIDPNPQP
jgi:hypothetical protein